MTPFIDPVRYEKAGEKDGILMLGADAKGYDVAHQLVEQVYRDTGVRTAPLRGIGFTANKFATETFMDEMAWQARHRSGGVPARAAARTRRAPTRWWSVRRRWRTGAASATAGRSASPTSTIPARRSPAWPKSRSTRQTGKIKVHNFWCAIDCGVPVQPDNVVAQTESSIVYGLGMALTERISIKNGAVEQSNFYDYIVPRMRDVPPMHIEVIATDNHPTGVGQMATPLIAPAVSNALMQLTGVRLRHAPFTEDRVKKALG